MTILKRYGGFFLLALAMAGLLATNLFVRADAPATTTHFGSYDNANPGDDESADNESAADLYRHQRRSSNAGRVRRDARRALV
ncbi:MAG: hypothetical protein MZU97_00265 [Bacillus subtilis]|nr:hypothetical protein [Bacillus subtilis]